MSRLINADALLEDVKVWLNNHKDDDRNIFDVLNDAPTVQREATPAESLQAHDDEILERAAKEIDAMVATYVESGNKYHEVSEGRERCVNKARAAMSCAETIRALKEVK